MSSVLLLADHDELNLPHLKNALRWLGTNYTVLNADILSSSRTSWSRWDDTTIVTMDDGTRHSAAEWRSVWTRRGRWQKVGIKDPGEHLTYIESSYTLVAMLRSLEDRYWMNPLQAQWNSDNRLVQAQLARSLGWLVPETLVTNEPSAAKAFLRQHGHLISKHISGGGPYERADRSLLTQSITLDDEDKLDHVAWCPTLLQRAIHKSVEMRAVVVDGKVFVGGIEPHRDERSQVDGRLWVLTDMRFARMAISTELEQRILSLVRAMGLTYGAMDLLVDPVGDVYFLEVNPSGQWGFIEKATGHPITETIAARLCGA